MQIDDVKIFRQNCNILGYFLMNDLFADNFFQIQY